MSHRERRAGQERRVAAAAHDARDLEQFVRVVGPSRAAGQHEIVAGAFALGPDVARGNPGERVEPIECARELHDHMCQAIPALHVRKLVQQHDP